MCGQPVMNLHTCNNLSTYGLQRSKILYVHCIYRFTFQGVHVHINDKTRNSSEHHLELTEIPVSLYISVG